MGLLERYRFHLAAVLVLAILAGAGLLYLRRAYPGEVIVLYPTPARSVNVYISGGVKQPGYYDLPETVRLADALRAAGGLSPQGDPSRLDLFVPEKGQPVITPAPGGLEPLDLNRATAAELERLPGVGPVLAQRIVELREKAGPFQRVEDLLAVVGIGPATLEKLRPLVTVNPP